MSARNRSPVTLLASQIANFCFPERPDCVTVAGVFCWRFLKGRHTTMTHPPVGVERRMGQRFAFNLPVSLRDVLTGAQGLGFTQDLSSRGAFLFTDMALREGTEIELTLRMPSEITLGKVCVSVAGVRFCASQSLRKSGTHLRRVKPRWKIPRLA